MIEKGRHKRPKILREQRFCPSCTQCNLYKNRNELLMAAETEAPNFINLYTQAQFIFHSQENKQLNYKIISKIHEWLTKKLEYNDK